MGEKHILWHGSSPTRFIGFNSARSAYILRGRLCKCRTLPSISSQSRKQVSSASPPLSKAGYPVDVADDNEMLSSKKKECNYRNGKWVPDSGRPLYSSFGCKQWLSESWSCRLTQRKDFAYEKFRWQPEACEMPEFEASQFLKRMQDKTIAYVGDSLGRQMFQSMMCMVTGGKHRPDVQDVGP